MYKTIFIIYVFLFSPLRAQPFLSNLNADKDSPVYTTYAAPLTRSEFVIDQGYQMVWYDPERSIEFRTDQAGSWSTSFTMNGRSVSKISEYNMEPVITASYSDLVRYTYYPFRYLKVDAHFQVYSSRIALLDMTIRNEGPAEFNLTVNHKLYITDRTFTGIKLIKQDGGILFRHTEKPDGWMKEHNIPFQHEYLNAFLMNSEYDSVRAADKSIVLTKAYNIKPGSSVSLRIIRGVSEPEESPERLIASCKKLFAEDLKKYITEDEKIYRDIPLKDFSNPDYNLVYWNAFSLMRQCMLPPEGTCSYNYYVFSREPQWGWGHGGQVFHESLAMLAYAYMDPVSAMNSQRVYFERQWENGYINYRTGPYLDEQIITNNEYTSSAPWFNWQNWEIYKITHDTIFLKEAYESGAKFYNYYTSNRDKDNDGLCEWGAHAVLESVRDAFAAVWDEVGDPSNYESVDVNSMLVSEANSLAAMAKELGKSIEEARWKQDAEKRAQLIRNTMWDDETGFFYNVDKKDNDFTFRTKNDLKRKEIIGFLPMWAGIATEYHAKRLYDHLKNEEEFYRPYGVPTLSADDPYYNPIGYWNGPVWIPWQYLVFRGMLNYGYEDLAEDLLVRMLDNVSWQLKNNHWFWEFYSADDYQAGWNKTYIWSGLIARMMIDVSEMKSNK